MRHHVASRESVFVFIATGLLVSLVMAGSAFGQSRNSITGHIFGADRRPLSDMNVELLDDLSRPISRRRTDASGRYTFYGLPSGRFKVRVLPLGTNYEEHEEEVEIVSFATATAGGGLRQSGSATEQRDIYLRPKKGTSPVAAAASVFVQEVPGDAKRLYEAGVVHLENRRADAAYVSLKSAIEVFPKYFAALELLGTEYVKAGHFQAGQILLSIAVEVNPRAYKSWHGMAAALYAQKMLPEALSVIEKAIEINPTSAESLLLAGSLLRQARRFGDAEKRLAKAVEVSNDSLPDVHWELALLYGNGLKRYKDAARELRLYLKARPDHKDAENIKKLIAEFEGKARTS